MLRSNLQTCQGKGKNAKMKSGRCRFGSNDRVSRVGLIVLWYQGSGTGVLLFTDVLFSYRSKCHKWSGLALFEEMAKGLDHPALTVLHSFCMCTT